MTFGSLFAGIGGFDLGLERAGMACAWQVEREPYAVRVLEKHWPNVRRHDDVCTFPPEEGNWEVDLICGGFPCQDISVAGKGAGLAGERSGLWHEMHRIIGELRPRFVIVENVAALLSRGMETVLGDLSQIGYDAEWHVIPASAIGAPHRRDRVWIVADASGEHCTQKRGGNRANASCSGTRRNNGGRSTGDDRRQLEAKTHGTLADSVSQRDAVRRHGSSVPPAVACRGRDARGSVSDCGAGCPQEPRQGACDVAHASGSRLEGQRQVSFRIGSQLENTGNSCWWETEPAVGRVVDGIPYRVDRLRGLGNAVVPQIVELIGLAIIESTGGPAGGRE